MILIKFDKNGKEIKKDVYTTYECRKFFNGQLNTQKTGLKSMNVLLKDKHMNKTIHD